MREIKEVVCSFSVDCQGNDRQRQGGDWLSVGVIILKTLSPVMHIYTHTLYMYMYRTNTPKLIQHCFGVDY